MKSTRCTLYLLLLALNSWFLPPSAAGIGFQTIGTNALSFDGTNGFVQIGAADLPPPWTAAMWVRREAAVGLSASLLISPVSALKLEQWPNSHQVGFTRFGVEDYYFNYTAPEGVWTHLAFVGTPSNTTLYVNGLLQDSLQATIPLPLQSLTSAIVDSMKGQVDELTVWRVARTAAQIRANFMLRAKGNERGLELLWHMDETNGVTTADATRRRHTGTLNGGVSRAGSGAFMGSPVIVSNGNDSGAGSLREAITSFGNVGVIRFAPGLNGKTIKLTSGPLVVNRNLIVDGSTLRRPPTISGNSTSRVFTVNGFTSSLLYKLKIVNGVATVDGGGGIFNRGNLALSDCVFSNNTTVGTTQISPISLLAPGQPILGVAAAPGSSGSSIAMVGTVAGFNNYPAVETPSMALDGNVNTKYLNFAEVNTGFIITIPAGLTTVAGFQLTTANDAPERDPITVSIEGAASPDPTTAASGVSWAPLYAGVSGLETDPGRLTQGTSVSFANVAVFNTYRMLITGVRDQVSANSMQFSEIQFFGLRALAGGAILNHADGTLTIERCAFGRNKADFGGAIHNEGELLANDSTFSANTATAEGGAVSVSTEEAAFYHCAFSGNSATRGGAISSKASLSLTGCSFSNNKTYDAPAGQAAGNGGAIEARLGELGVNECVFINNSTGRGGTGGGGSIAGFGGAIFNGTEAAINNSTFWGNHTGAGGQGSDHGGYGGDGGDGGAIRNNGEIAVNNSTFNGNWTGNGGYAGDGGAISVAGPTVLNHATLSGNRTGSGPSGGNGGGIWAGGPLTLNSSVVAGNQAQASNDISLTYIANQSFVGGDPMLNPPGFFGGPTPTMPPLAGSPLIDAAGITGLLTDQRGFIRGIGAGSDIGAVEVQDSLASTAPSIVAGPQGGIVATSTTYTLRVGVVGTEPFTYQWQFNGRSVPGGTNATLVLTNVQRAHAGSYKVKVSNAFGSKTSGSARLKVVQSVTISAQPQSVSAGTGVGVTLRVTVTGGTPVKYQWRRNGIDVPGATRSSLTIPSLNVDNAGDYRVLVSNPVGSQLSDTATVSVNP